MFAARSRRCLEAKTAGQEETPEGVGARMIYWAVRFRNGSSTPEEGLRSLLWGRDCSSIFSQAKVNGRTSGLKKGCVIEVFRSLLTCRSGAHGKYQKNTLKLSIPPEAEVCLGGFG